MLAILAAATVAAIPAPKPVIVALPATADICKPSGRYEIADPALLYRDDGKAKLQALDELPKANHEKAVLRTVGGCSAPMVVRYGAGR